MADSPSNASAEPSTDDQGSLVIWRFESPEDEREAEDSASGDAALLEFGDLGPDEKAKQARDRLRQQTLTFLLNWWTKLQKTSTAGNLQKITACWAYLQQVLVAHAPDKLKVDSKRPLLAQLVKIFDWHSRSLEDELLDVLDADDNDSPSGLGAIVMKLLMYRPDLQALVVSAMDAHAKPGDFFWTADQLVKKAIGMDDLVEGGTYSFRPPKASLADLLNSPQLDDVDRKKLQWAYAHKGGLISLHYVGHTENPGGDRWSGHLSSPVNEIQRIFKKLFKKDNFERYGIFKREKDETVVVGYGREMIVNAYSRATKRGIGANIKLFDAVRYKQLVSKEEVGGLFKEAAEILTDFAGSAFLRKPALMTPELLAADPFWSRMQPSLRKYGIKASTLYMILVGESRPHLFKKFSAEYPVPDTAFTGEKLGRYRDEENLADLREQREVNKEWSLPQPHSRPSHTKMKESASRNRLDKMQEQASSNAAVASAVAAASARTSAARLPSSESTTAGGPTAQAAAGATIAVMRGARASAVREPPPRPKKPRHS